MKRRNFIQSSLATATILTTPLSSFSQQIKSNLDFKILNTNWGFQGSIDEFCKKIKEEGYDGMELWWPSKADEKQLFDALQKYQLEVGFLCGGSSSDPKVHSKEFADAVNAASSNKSQKPLYVNCHSGKDFFSFDDNCKMIEHTLNQSEKTGVEIIHETHRGRMCYSAPITRAFLEKYPKMKLTLDISHWTNVHESMLSNQKENVELAITRTAHIHARVGHEEGPQVNDPRAPEWKKHVDTHLAWWDQVVAKREKEGYKTMTMLTEFGPPSYLQTLPYTNQPVANQWEINVHMKDLLRNRYVK